MFDIDCQRANKNKSAQREMESQCCFQSSVLRGACRNKDYATGTTPGRRRLHNSAKTLPPRSKLKAPNFHSALAGLQKIDWNEAKSIGISTTHDFLLQREDVVVEELVQLFVRVVDAQLLERVAHEILETENVEHAQKARRVLAGVGARVDVIHQPGERPRVQRLCHRMPVLLCLKN
jgi:hypothetical protein